MPPRSITGNSAPCLPLHAGYCPARPNYSMTCLPSQTVTMHCQPEPRRERPFLDTPVLPCQIRVLRRLSSPCLPRDSTFDCAGTYLACPTGTYQSRLRRYAPRSALTRLNRLACRTGTYEALSRRPNRRLACPNVLAITHPRIEPQSYACHDDTGQSPKLTRLACRNRPRTATLRRTLPAFPDGSSLYVDAPRPRLPELACRFLA